MQISQLEIDQWPAPLMRTRSGNSRDNKKVSCETLSKVDWYSRRHHEAQLYYQSDGDDEAIPASEAEDEHEADEDEDYKEERDDSGKLESHGYGEGLSAQGHHFLACFPSKSAHTKPVIAISSPGRETKKTERGLRTYPSPIPHSGSLLPQSGRLLPHSGPIKLHVGSHANTHTNSKVSGSIRGSSLIPSNIGGKSSKSSGFGEPSSPKVTCLGRVKIKQKYCREMGRLADMAAVAPNEKVHKSIGDQMMRLKRRMHRAYAVEEEAVPTEERQKASLKVAHTSGRGKLCSDDGKKANKAHTQGSMALLKKSQHGWGSHAEDTVTTDSASDSDSKGQKGKWRLMEASARMRLHGGSDKKKRHPPDAFVDNRRSSSQADCAIDLNRFRSSDQLRTQDNRLSKSLASLSIGDVSRKIEQTDDEEFVPQVPPPNSLLLMRNSKSRGAACSSSYRRQGADSYDEEAVLAVGRQEHLSSLKDGSLKQLPSLLGVEMDERAMVDVHEETASFKEMKVKKLCADAHEQMDEKEFVTMVDVHEQMASFKEMKAKKLCVVVPAECEPPKTSLPKLSPEAASLWQRRSIMKLSALHVG